MPEYQSGKEGKRTLKGFDDFDVCIRRDLCQYKLSDDGECAVKKRAGRFV